MILSSRILILYFQALCFSGSYNLYHLHGFTFRTTRNFSSFAYSLFSPATCVNREAPLWGFLQSLRCSFLSEKEKHHWTIHCCIVIEWLKLFQTTLKSERWRYGEKFSGDFCTWLPMIYHGVMWSSPSSLYRCQFTQSILAAELRHIVPQLLFMIYIFLRPFNMKFDLSTGRLQHMY